MQNNNNLLYILLLINMLFIIVLLVYSVIVRDQFKNAKKELDTCKTEKVEQNIRLQLKVQKSEMDQKKQVEKLFQEYQNYLQDIKNIQNETLPNIYSDSVIFEFWGRMLSDSV